MNTWELVVYEKVKNDELVGILMEPFNNEDLTDIREELHLVTRKLLEFASCYGFSGNIWQDYLTFLLVTDENGYSLSAEKVGEIHGSLNEYALDDLCLIRELYSLDLQGLADVSQVSGLGNLMNYEAAKEGTVFNKRIRGHIELLARDLAFAESGLEFKEVLTAFYKQFGVGKFGLHKAFRLSDTNPGEILPIRKIAHVHLDDLVGYEIAKKKLIDNTEAFVAGRKANNCLLFGDAGTGKSSSIKAILNQYYDEGLRIVEVYKHQFKELNNVIDQLKDRNYKFIIYMDDLSFEDFEIEYKYLKAVIEGGLARKPENILIYATSNRRHLIKETFKDKETYGDELHGSDTVQEKLSLVDRFGITIYFEKPERRDYEQIVLSLGQKNGIDMPTEELIAKANQWEMYHGGRSGRTAQQFIDYLLGKEDA